MNTSHIGAKILGALALSLTLAAGAFALDLGAAKNQGLVGETATGYLAAVKSSADVDALVKDINEQRKAEYERIAKQNKISLEAVEVRAGQRALGKTPAGQYVNDGSGWTIK